MEAATARTTPRIIQVFNRYLEPGGEENWVNVLAREIGLPACIFDSADWRKPGAPAHWRQALLMFSNAKSSARLREFHREHGAQAWLFHNVLPVGSAALYREALRLQVPVIQYAHSFRPFSISGYLTPPEVRGLPSRWLTYFREIRRAAWQNSRLKTAWHAAVLAAARALGWFRAIKAWIAVSDFMRDRFIEAGVPPGDIFTLRHYWKPRPAEAAPRDDRYCIFLGRLIEMKGVRVALAAWDIVARATGGRGPRLFMAGTGELAHVIRAAAENNPLVTFCGQVGGAEKERLLAGCSAVVAPSICVESFGLVACEAYDFQKPVLAARSGGLAESVQHRQTGLLHDPGDAAELARHVIDLDASPERRGEMGRRGRLWLEANTGEQEWRRKFAEIVAHALAAR